VEVAADAVVLGVVVVGIVDSVAVGER